MYGLKGRLWGARSGNGEKGERGTRRARIEDRPCDECRAGEQETSKTENRGRALVAGENAGRWHVKCSDISLVSMGTIALDIAQTTSVNFVTFQSE